MKRLNKKINWRQTFAFLLFVAAVCAGLLQYNFNMFDPEKQLADNLEDGNYGDPVYVGSNNVGDIGTFEQARIERDEARSKYKDELSAIVGQNSDLEATANAQSAMVRFSAVQNSEAKIESILKQKGFEDVLVYIGEDNSIDVLVKADKLDRDKAALIMDTASRQAGVGADKIFIRSCSK